MVRSKRSLGQNFLVGSHYPRRIVDLVSPQADETIVEIGPGKGALTKLLVESGAWVIAVELDRELTEPLTELFAGSSNFHLIEADALELDFCQVIAPASSARVVANLPYYISTPILQRLVEQRNCLREMTVMLQREVVDRIVAGPGGKEYGYLSVFVQLYCEAKRLFDVPPGAFRPAPKVHSSVVRLRPRSQLQVLIDDEVQFIQLVKTLFAQRRKTILNNLRAGQTGLGLKDPSQILTALEESLIDPQRRAETLSIAELARLSSAIKQRI